MASNSESRKWRLVFWGGFGLIALGLLRGFDSGDFRACIEKFPIAECRAIWPFSWRLR
jgi:hypothetical protein